MDFFESHKLNMLRKAALPDNRKEPKEHDFTNGAWGHAIADFHDQGNGKWKAIGHGLNIHPKDTILIRMSSGRVARWKVESIEYFRDPRDMFTAIIEAVEYADEPTPESQ